MITNADARKVLLVDDDEDECSLFKEALDDLNLTSDLAYLNQSIHLEKAIAEEVPDIVFLDIKMPKRNGFECLDVLRKEIDYNKPVIMYSNSFLQVDVDEAYNKGASLFIKKPTSLAGLGKVIQAILTKDWTSLEEITLDFSKQKKVLMCD